MLFTHAHAEYLTPRLPPTSFSVMSSARTSLVCSSNLCTKIRMRSRLLTAKRNIVTINRRAAGNKQRNGARVDIG